MMAHSRPGPTNSIADVEGLRIGQVEDAAIKTGVTTLVCDHPAVAGVHVMGGAPGTRETDLLAPHNIVETVDAVVLSGGSAFGLAAADGVQSELRRMGRGFAVGELRIPIVPCAILFDLINGGKKDWGAVSPYAEMGRRSVVVAEAAAPAVGSVGAGFGATVGGPSGGLKGGLGTASAALPGGMIVAAIVAVNALGSAVADREGRFWAAPFEREGEFGGRGLPVPEAGPPAWMKFAGAQEGSNTTIGVIATNAVLTKAQAKRLAIAAHDGFARALWPSHTPLDGDLVFSLATGGSEVVPDLQMQIELGTAAAGVMARAVARGVYAASPANDDPYPCWAEAFGGRAAGLA